MHACAAEFPFVSGTEHSNTIGKKKKRDMRGASPKIADGHAGGGLVRTDKTSVHMPPISASAAAKALTISIQGS